MRRAAPIAAFAALLLAPAVVHAQASPSPFTSAQRYDAVGRVTGTISADPDGVGTGNPFLAVRNTYDQAGRLTKVETGTLSSWQSEATAPTGWTGFAALRIVETQYDVMGRKTRETLREGQTLTIRAVTQYSYDTAGQPDCTAIRMNPADFASPPASACTQGTGGADRITRNFYDAANQRLQLRAGVGTADEGAEASWAYNLNGQVVTVIDGNGNQAALVYDGHGRQNCWMFPSTTRPGAFDDATQTTALLTAGALSGGLDANGHCASGDYEAYTYDANGNRLTLRKRDTHRIAFAYDNLNRVTAKTYPDGGATQVHYGYDLRNLQLFARYTSTGGQGITNTYDGFGRLSTSAIDMSGTARTLSYRYDRNGNRDRITHPDGTHFVTTYDGLNRMTAIADPTSLRVVAGYWPHGGPKHTIRNDGTLATYGYDGVQRLANINMGRDFPGWTPDLLMLFPRNPAGQIGSLSRDSDAYVWTGHYAVQRAYTTDGLNRYGQTSSPTGGTTTLGYDANGNLTAETPPSPAPATTYAYDIENRLVGRTGGVALVYDPLGRLFQVSSTTGPTTQFLYDGDALVGEYVSGAMTRRYVHGRGADVPWLSYSIGPGGGIGDLSYLHADHQGSIIAVSSGGTMTTINRYDEYGIPATTNSGRFQYTGQIWLPEIGMYHYKARVYSPTLGRFLQTDPIGYEDQVNLYAYVGNDPVNNVDPTGEEMEDPSAVIRWAEGANRDRREHPLSETEREIGAFVVRHFPLVGQATRIIEVVVAVTGGAEAPVNPALPGRASTLRPGPNARESIPARGPGRLNAREQREVNRIGNTHGCHTCSARQPGTRSGNWIGDHQLPSALNPHGRPQRIYPHCRRCSNRQGGEATRAKRRAPPPPPRRRNEE